jgi:hypothetical protein
MSNVVSLSEFSASNALGAVSGVMVEHQVNVKTIVTEGFKLQADQELSKELALIDEQAQQLEAQYQFSLQELEKLARQGQPVQAQLEQLNRDAQERRNQLAGLKMEVSAQLANLDKLEVGAMIITGMLKGQIELKVGDNMYDKMQPAQILVCDGRIESIQMG